MSYQTNPIRRPEEFKKVERLFKIVSENNLGFIAGGFPRYLVSNRSEPSPYRDVDVFVTSEDSYWKLKSILREQENLKVKIETNMSVTFITSKNEVWKDCPMINLIKPQKNNKLLTYGQTLEEILDNFDFSICRVGILNETECLTDYYFLQDEKKKKLRILKMESPVACIARIAKYAGKGYRISVMDIMDIMKEWNERGPEYHKKLFDALERKRNQKFSSWDRSEDDIPPIGLSLLALASTVQKVVDDAPGGLDKIVDSVQEVKNGEEESWFGVEDSDDLYDLVKVG